MKKNYSIPLTEITSVCHLSALCSGSGGSTPKTSISFADSGTGGSSITEGD